MERRLEVYIGHVGDTVSLNNENTGNNYDRFDTCPRGIIIARNYRQIRRRN